MNPLDFVPGFKPEETKPDTDDEVSETTARAARYTPLDWHALFKKAPTEPEWLLEPVLERGRIVALFAPAKTGKSLITLEWVTALAAGREVFGNPRRAPVRVLYVDLENTQADIRERLEELGYGPEDLGNLTYLSFPSLPTLDTHQGGQDLLALAEHYAAELVVIDTTCRVIAGEENSSDTFKNLYRHAMMPLKARGITVLRLDHSGKDLERGQRGSSAKADDVDAVWLLIGRTDTTFTLKRTHARQAHGPDMVNIVRRQEPLRHVPESILEPAIADAVAALDRLGVPDDVGREKARAALLDIGMKIGNKPLSAAVAHRKQRQNLSGTGHQTDLTEEARNTCPQDANSQDVSASQTCPGQVADSPDRHAAVPPPRPVPSPLPQERGQVGQDPSRTTPEAEEETISTATGRTYSCGHSGAPPGYVGPCSRACAEASA
jgi:hypothetical protein